MIPSDKPSTISRRKVGELVQCLTMEVSPFLSDNLPFRLLLVGFRPAQGREWGIEGSCLCFVHFWSRTREAWRCLEIIRINEVEDSTEEWCSDLSSVLPSVVRVESEWTGMKLEDWFSDNHFPTLKYSRGSSLVGLRVAQVLPAG